MAVLIGALSVALFNASKDDIARNFAHIDLRFVSRDPGHFDQILGPVLISAFLFFAMLANFIIRGNAKIYPSPGLSSSIVFCRISNMIKTRVPEYTSLHLRTLASHDTHHQRLNAACAGGDGRFYDLYGLGLVEYRMHAMANEVSLFLGGWPFPPARLDAAELRRGGWDRRHGTHYSDQPSLPSITYGGLLSTSTFFAWSHRGVISPSITGVDLEHALASSLWPDAEFDRLFQRLAEDFNRARPVVALPPEILVLIFMSLQLEAPPYRKKAWMRLIWVRVTHVCRRWREVAISSAIIWTHISDLGDNWTRIFVSALGMHCSENIANNLYRMRVLDISGAHDSMLSLVDRLHIAAPLLEVLPVGISTDDYDSRVHRIPRISVQKWGRAISSSAAKPVYCPQKDGALQELRLYGAIRVLPGDEELLEPISLPQLRSLCLDQSTLECISILRSISLKPGTTLNIDCSDETAPVWETDEAVHTLLDITMKHCFATDILNPTPRLRCVLIQSSPTTAHLPLVVDDRYRLQPEDLVLLLLPREYPDDFVGILKAMLRMLPRDRLRELEVGNRLGLTVDQWGEVFEFADVHWPHLDALLIESDPACAFLEALLKLDVSARVPRLQTLVIDAEPHGLDAPALDTATGNVLLARYHGVPLQRIVLRMSDCRPDVGVWKDTLAAIVPEFEYQRRAGPRMGIDGRNSPYFSEDDDDEEEDEDGDGGGIDEDDERAYYGL
ncbi:hypothetical protein EVG20_g1337 [Dentipellis fragilis]|uniref:F-box domain-containing protein n=1 Tax=Dentipellis fragilis TaxID=205917 RepID=A0A4Y9ZA71_9AGAM|nr:hypothetical protein EVG20_g1337 [Dentipellis fragilis]